MFAFYYSISLCKKDHNQTVQEAAKSWKALSLLKLVRTWNQSLSQPRVIVLGLFLQVQREHFLCFHLFHTVRAVNSSFRAEKARRGFEEKARETCFPLAVE